MGETGSHDNDIALSFLRALDRNEADDLIPWVLPDATWWVDSGFDRAAGAHGVDPGSDRPWPLHGTMPMSEKIELLRGIRTRFPDGCRQKVWNSFAGGGFALAEVEGDGVFASGRRYENRYAFVFRLHGDRIAEVREYLDTEHAADVFVGRNLDRRTNAEGELGDPVTAQNADEETALALVAAVAAADPEAALPLFVDGATWWADSGRRRDVGRHDRPFDPETRNLMYGRVPAALRIPLIGGMKDLFQVEWTLVPTRIFSGSGHVAIEISSRGDSGKPKLYQNRYCFVLSMEDHRIRAVREYCDTRHAFDVFRGG